MDVSYPYLVAGTAERQIQVINLTNPTVLFRVCDTIFALFTAYHFKQELVNPLKWQTRVVSCFPDAKGVAIGSIEGRVAIQYFDEKDAG